MRRIAVAAQVEVARDRAVGADGAVAQHVGARSVCSGPKRSSATRGGEQLHRRRRLHHLAGVLREQRVAARERDDHRRRTVRCGSAWRSSRRGRSRARRRRAARSTPWTRRAAARRARVRRARVRRAGRFVGVLARVCGRLRRLRLERRGAATRALRSRRPRRASATSVERASERDAQRGARDRMQVMHRVVEVATRVPDRDAAQPVIERGSVRAERAVYEWDTPASHLEDDPPPVQQRSRIPYQNSHEREREGERRVHRREPRGEERAIDPLPAARSARPS